MNPQNAPGSAVAGRSAEIRAAAARVQARIAEAAQGADREPGAILLIAVSKLHPAEDVVAARAAGLADFGEVRAQELKTKAEQIGPGVRWHFIGRLQRNKVKDVVGRATLIHSVDRMELAEAIAERAASQGRVQRVLVQVNAGEDPDKAGCDLDEAPLLVARVRELQGIAVSGLTAIPPLDIDPVPTFDALRELRDELRERYPEVQHLSMGMSGDLEAAVAHGATIVRIGEAIFGPRPTPAHATGGTNRERA